MDPHMTLYDPRSETDVLGESYSAPRKCTVAQQLNCKVKDQCGPNHGVAC